MINIVNIVAKGEQMRAIEVAGNIDTQRNIIVLDEPVHADYPSRVRVILLFPEVKQYERDSDIPLLNVESLYDKGLNEEEDCDNIPF